jgi:thymidylate synthase
MKAYLDLMRKILERGEVREDRTGTGTLGLFGEQVRFDLSEGFPIPTTKRLPFRSVVAELLWFLRGDTRVDSLRADGCTIWDEWATAEQCARFGRREGDLGPIYGWQWRSFGLGYGDYGEPGLPVNGGRGGFDQIRWLVDEIKKNPYSRRLIVSAWNPEDAARVALPPCHTLFQCCVRKRPPIGVGPDNVRAWMALRDGKEYDPRRNYEDCEACRSSSGGCHTHEPRLPRLSLHLYMRSCDYFLGAPFNVASYALLTHMIARDCGLGVGELTVSFGDVHLYRNHLDQAREQLSREPRALPRLVIDSDAPRSILDPWWCKEMVSLLGYDPYPTIKAQVSV